MEITIKRHRLHKVRVGLRGAIIHTFCWTAKQTEGRTHLGLPPARQTNGHVESFLLALGGDQ